MRFWVLLLGLAAAVGCGERSMPVSPAGKASTDCSLAEILAGTCGDTADPTLDRVPEGYVAPVDSTETEEEETEEEETEEEETEEEEEEVVAPVDSTAAAEALAELRSRGIAYTDSAFVVSARAGNLEVVKLFVEAGMLVDTFSDGATALHMSALAGRLEVVKYLVGQGAIVNTRTRPSWRGSTPLHYAAQNGRLEVVKYLVGQGAYMNATDGGGTTPLAMAAVDGELEVVKYLIGQGADVNATGINKVTPLHLAARRYNLDVVKYLVEQGADLDATDINGWTMLHNAAWGGSLEVVRYLVGQGADVNATDDSGDTALHNAAFVGRLEVVRYLVGQGADVNATDDRGRTPRDFAAARARDDFRTEAEVVAYLLVVKYLESVAAAAAEDTQVPVVFRWPEEFTIRIEYRHVAGPIFNQADKDLIEEAARQWESVVVRGGKSFYVLVVEAHTLDSIGGPFSGTGGYRTVENGVPVSGQISLAQRAQWEGNFRLLALHEIGHALGLVGGGYWLGPEFQRRYGSSLNGVPFALRYGNHFNVYGEIMGAHDGLVSEVTELSATVLDDIGYTVDYDAVGPFPGEWTSINGHTFTIGDIVPKPTLPLFCGVGH